MNKPCGCTGFPIRLSNLCPTHRKEVQERDRELFAAHFDRCIITDRPSTQISGKMEYVVEVVWKNVDRTIVHRWSTFNKLIALRMADAITAGVVLFKLRIATDIIHQTYVEGISQIYWRHANADLKRLGF